MLSASSLIVTRSRGAGLAAACIAGMLGGIAGQALVDSGVVVSRKASQQVDKVRKSSLGQMRKFSFTGHQSPNRVHDCDHLKGDSQSEDTVARRSSAHTCAVSPSKYDA